MRARRAALLTAAALGAGALGWLALQGIASHGAPRFAAQDCRRVALLAPDGRPLRGVEDIALTPDGAALVLSAHDRRDADAPAGLFTVALTALGRARATVAVLSQRPWRPHGLAVAADGRVAVVARDGAGGAAVLTGALRDGALIWTERREGRELCRANDLTFVGARLLLTLDRGSCGLSAADLAPWARTGRLVTAEPGSGLVTLRDRLAFANGVAAMAGGAAVAETRGGAVLLPDGRRVATPGAPDNLTLDAQGALVAALHPSTLALGLALAGLPLRPGARIVRIAPADGAVATLFDDPRGALFSAATTAILTGGTLVAGSVLDAGLLVCAAP